MDITNTLTRAAIRDGHPEIRAKDLAEAYVKQTGTNADDFHNASARFDTQFGLEVFIYTIDEGFAFWTFVYIGGRYRRILTPLFSKDGPVLSAYTGQYPGGEPVIKILKREIDNIEQYCEHE